MEQRKLSVKNKITIESMTTTKTADIAATTVQINDLAKIGCDVIRVAVPDAASADAIGKIRENITIPLIADIHFDHKLALRAIAAGADKIRINPGNIGSAAGGSRAGNHEHINAIADACNRKNIPIRIGVNSGSLEKKILEKYGGVTPEAMVESTLNHIKLLNKYDFDNIWLSAKSSSVPLTVKTYRLLQKQTDYPLHVGVTEAGTEYNGIIKSSIGIGALLLDGIGDSIRVSLTAPPEKEIEAAKALLKALGLRPGVDIISCPTCGRCNIDVIGMANEVEKRLGKDNENNLTIAVMGCAVNGPGEAKQADFGIAGVGVGKTGAGEVGAGEVGAGETGAGEVGTGEGGEGKTGACEVGAGKTGAGEGVIFAKGKIIKKVPMDKLVDELFIAMDN